MIGFIDTITQLDQDLFFFFNGKHSPFWDIIMSLFTRTEYWALLYLTILGFIIRKYRAKAVVILVLLAVSIVICDQFSGLIKDATQRLRPSHDPAIQHLVHNVLTKGGLYSYFSAHAANTFAVATFTSLLFRRVPYGIFIFLWALMVSYTRIYLGLHYPLDILTGILFGVLTGWALFKLLIFVENRFLLLQFPKLTETKLKNKEFRFIFILFLTIIITTVLVVNRLQHFNWI
ncbi:MAG: phosphatase PAP2 family protein [Mangrovibacterium sp.]